MKYIRSIELDKNELRIELIDEEAINFKDIYMIVENYRKQVKIIQIWQYPECPIELNANTTSAYDIQNLIEKLI